MLDFAIPIKTVKTQVEIEEPINTQLEKYRDFIEKTNGIRPTTDSVINRALERIFERDAAFKEFTGKGRTRRASEAQTGS